MSFLGCLGEKPNLVQQGGITHKQEDERSYQSPRIFASGLSPLAELPTDFLSHGARARSRRLARHALDRMACGAKLVGRDPPVRIARRGLDTVPRAGPAARPPSQYLDLDAVGQPSRDAPSRFVSEHNTVAGVHEHPPPDRQHRRTTRPGRRIGVWAARTSHHGAHRRGNLIRARPPAPSRLKQIPRALSAPVRGLSTAPNLPPGTGWR